jgi:redox-sensitive bicupin YhaK (pirin superfamily)
MSWQPCDEAVLARPEAAGAVQMTIAPRSRDIGSFEVHRVLPHAQRRMVGPFIFFDQMGPAVFQPGQGMDVRPHPHIGLATVTYLFDGRVMHRDSEGNALEIRPGAMNLMTAGRGIVHSERSPAEARHGGEHLFGIQSWIALPKAHEETDPGFQHFDEAALPLVKDKGLQARIIAGSAFGSASPVKTFSDWLYVEMRMDAGVSAPLDAGVEERAVHVVEGEVEISGDRFQGPLMLVLRPGDALKLTAVTSARVMLLGGPVMDGPRHIWWNFVSSSLERIEQAKADWEAGRFPHVPGETEFIPLPES